MTLKKSDILQGQKCKKVPVEALDGEVWIRRLTDPEVADIQAVMASDQSKMTIKGDKVIEEETEIDARTAMKNSRKSRHAAIAYSLTNEKSGEEWEPEEVAEGLSPDAIDELAHKIAEFSGFLGMRSFRGWKREDTE